MKPTQPKVRIKDRNMWAIKDFALSRSGTLQGSKLEALYMLIQKRGEPITTQDNPLTDSLNGVKALCFTEGEHIAMLRTGSPTKFYPCSLKTILLSEL